MGKEEGKEGMKKIREGENEEIDQPFIHKGTENRKVHRNNPSKESFLRLLWIKPQTVTEEELL